MNNEQQRKILECAAKACGRPHEKFKLLPVTVMKCLPDDVPRYAKEQQNA